MAIAEACAPAERDLATVTRRGMEELGRRFDRARPEVAIVLTFGYAARERDPLRRTPEEWSARANRKPLDEIVERL